MAPHIRTAALGALMVLYPVLTASAFSATDSLAAPSTHDRLPEKEQIQKTIGSTKVIFINGDDSSRPSRDSVESLLQNFYVNQFRHFQDPRSPYFMFMSKDANLAMGIGGVIRMRGLFDWNGAIPVKGFAPYFIPVPSDPTERRRIWATPAGTSIYYTILGRGGFLKDFMGYVEGNFDGYDGVGFKLKKAYFIMGDWTVGYATSTFADPSAESPTIDGAGPNGDISRTTVLVRYMHTFRDRWTVAGSVEFPSSQIDADGVDTKKCDDYVPDLSAMAQYQWDDGVSHVRLSALLRWMAYRDLRTSVNHTVPGWGVQLSATAKIIPDFSLYLLSNVGQGHGSFTGDLSDGSYDLIGDPQSPGRMYAPTSVALTFGAKYNFRPNIYACLALAEQRYLPKHTPEGTAYKYGLYGAVNLFWEITPRIRVGAEYLAGKRMNFDGSHGNANRIDALFQLDF